MNNEKNPVILSKSAQNYLRFVTAAFCGAGLLCAGLYCGLFGWIDRVNAYIMATELFHSMIRTVSAATMMTLSIDFLSRRAGEDS